MKPKKLSKEDRAFFTHVSEAAFANPFGSRRQELDRKILDVRKTSPWADIVPKLLERIRQKLVELDRDRPLRWQDVDAGDRQIMTNVFLFNIFHQYIGQFDALIQTQIKQGEKPVPVPFADQALKRLKERGFSEEWACRYFSLFFQIRRAYFFIVKGLLGNCAGMRHLRENLWNHIFTADISLYETNLWNRMEDFSTLLLGPTGSGKGAAAAAIGRSGYIPFDPQKKTFAKSFTTTFVSVNLTQYAETLLESELFGHTKGAFTGAVSSHEGLLSLCGKHGSIFLDEIGDVTPAIQIKLLKILEERTFTPVGSHKTEHFHGRVIAATHRSLDTLRREGVFRDDFYYRLCSDCIEVPSLHQRIKESSAELDLLIAHTVDRIIGEPNETLCQTVRKVIDQRLGPDYPWPGNVRELAQCVRRVIIKQDYQGDQKPMAAGATNDLTEQIRSGSLRAEDLLARYCKMLYNRFGTYEEVARRADLDRRTVKRYIQMD